MVVKSPKSPKKSRIKIDAPPSPPGGGGDDDEHGGEDHHAKDTWVSMWSAVKPLETTDKTTTTKKISTPISNSSISPQSPASPKKTSSFLSARDLWSQRVTTTTGSSSTAAAAAGESSHTNNKSVRDQLSARSLASSFPLSPTKKKGVQKTFSSASYYQALDHDPLPLLQRPTKSATTTTTTTTTTLTETSSDDENGRNKSPPPPPVPRRKSGTSPLPEWSPKKENKKSAPARRSSSTSCYNEVGSSPTRSGTAVAAGPPSITATTVVSSPHRRATSLNSGSPQRTSSATTSTSYYSVRTPKPTALLSRCLSLPDRKAVSFCDRDDVREIERRVDLTADIFRNVWWSEADYLEMRKGWETILFLLEAGQDVCEETLCTRGLHRRTTTGAWDLFEIQRDALNAVLIGQDEQIKKFKAIVDHDEIAHVYSLVATPHREAAHQQGLADAREAHEITKNLKPRRKKKKKSIRTAEDEETVAATTTTTTKSPTTPTKKKSKAKGLPPTAFNDSMKALDTNRSSSSSRRRNLTPPPPPLQELPDEMFEPCDEPVKVRTPEFVVQPEKAVKPEKVVKPEMVVKPAKVVKPEKVVKSRRAVSFNPDVLFIRNVKVKDMQKAIDRRWLGKHDLARIEADFKKVIAVMEQPVGQIAATTAIDETAETIRGLEMSTEAGAMELQERRKKAMRVVLDNQKTELAESLAKTYCDATRDSRKQAQKRGRSDQRAAKEARVRRRSIGQSTSFRSMDDKDGGDMQSVASVSTDGDSVFAEPEFVRLARRRQQNRRSSHNDISAIINLVVIEEPTENNEEEMGDNDDYCSGKALMPSIRGDAVLTRQTDIATTSQKSKTIVKEATAGSVVVRPSAVSQCAATIPSSDQSNRRDESDSKVQKTDTFSDFKPVDTSKKRCDSSDEVPHAVEVDLDKKHQNKAGSQDRSKAAEQQPPSSKPRQRRRLSSSHAPSLRNLESSNRETDEDQNPSLLWIRQRELLKSVGRRSPVPAPSTHWARNRGSASLNAIQNKQNTSATDDQSDTGTLPTCQSCPNPPSVPMVLAKPSAPLVPSPLKTAFFARETKSDSPARGGRRSPIPAVPSTHWERNRSSQYLDQLKNKRNTSEEQIKTDTIPTQQSCATPLSTPLVPSKSETTCLTPVDKDNAVAGVVGRSQVPAPLTHLQRNRSALSLDDFKNTKETHLRDEPVETDTLPTTQSCPIPPTAPLVPSDSELTVVSIPKVLDGKPQTIQLPAQTPLLGVTRIMSDMTECSVSIQSQKQTSENSSTNLAVMQIASKPVDDRGDSDGLGRQGSGRFSVLSGDEGSNEERDKSKNETSSKASWQQARSVFSGGEPNPDMKRGKALPTRSVSSVGRGVLSVKSIDLQPSEGRIDPTMLTISLNSACPTDNRDCSNRSFDQSARSFTGRITILSVEEEGDTNEDEIVNLELHSYPSNHGPDIGETANEGGHGGTFDIPNIGLSANAANPTEVHVPLVTDEQIRNISSNDCGELPPTNELELKNEWSIIDESEARTRVDEAVPDVVSESSIHKRQRPVEAMAEPLGQTNCPLTLSSIKLSANSDAEIRAMVPLEEQSIDPSEQIKTASIGGAFCFGSSGSQQGVLKSVKACAAAWDQSMSEKPTSIALLELGKTDSVSSTKQERSPSEQSLSSIKLSANSDAEKRAVVPLEEKSIDPPEQIKTASTGGAVCFGSSGSQQGALKSVKAFAAAWDQSMSEQPTSIALLELGKTDSVSSTKQERSPSEQSLSSIKLSANSDAEKRAMVPLEPSVDPSEQIKTASTGGAACIGSSGSQQGAFKSVKACAAAWDHSLSEQPTSISLLELDKADFILSTKQERSPSEQSFKSQEGPTTDFVVIPNKKEPREDTSVASSALTAELTTDPVARKDLPTDSVLDTGKNVAGSVERMIEPTLAAAPAQSERTAVAPPQFAVAGSAQTPHHVSADVSERTSSPKRNFFFNRLFSKGATENKVTASCATARAAPLTKSHSPETRLGTKQTSDDAMVGGSLQELPNKDPLTFATPASPSRRPDALDDQAQTTINEGGNRTGITSLGIASQIVESISPSIAESRAAAVSEEDAYICFKVKTSKVIRVPTADGRTIYLIIDPSMLDESSSQVQASS